MGRAGSLGLRASDGDARDLDGGGADADRDRLAILAAGPDAVGELVVAAEHGDAAQDLGAVADQVDPLEGRGQLAVLDEVALGEREDEVAVRDVDLAAAEALGEDAALDR